MATHRICIHSNEGYAPDQVRAVTVQDLRDMLDGLEDDDLVVLEDLNNRRGARWGTIDLDSWIEEVEGGDDEDEE